MEGTQKGYLFCQKWYIKGKGSDLGAEPSRIKFVLVPPSLSSSGNDHKADVSFYNLLYHLESCSLQDPNNDIICGPCTLLCPHYKHQFEGK